MEISIVAGGQNLQNHVRQVGQGRFEVSYTPVASGPHHGTVTFNGLLVPGKDPSLFNADCFLNFNRKLYTCNRTDAYYSA